MIRSGALFLDSAGWFAALSPRETGHALASQTYADAARGGILLVTTTLVTAEMHALILRGSGTKAGLLFLEHVLEGSAHVVVQADVELIQAAIGRWIRPFADRRYSLCDAVSFEVMRRERITNALTYDRRFVAAGYEILR